MHKMFIHHARKERPASECLRELLALTAPGDLQTMFEAAYRTKVESVGPVVYFRGLIEFSNLCEKNCYYCGIRRGNREVERYSMSRDAIIEAATWAWKQRYGSIVLQAGERQGRRFDRFVEELLRGIHKATRGRLGITLSLGEQSPDTYRRWFDAGAHRYLLRIETSNPRLYRKLHPRDHSFEARRACLGVLREIGYQVGTGVMIGLPGQTIEDLANDIFFFLDTDVDMIGMGPYIEHRNTPLAGKAAPYDRDGRLALTLKMIALTRMILPDVNIAATTALQALRPDGRELGLMAGANVIMPNITETRYRTAYQLYEGKPCVDEDAALCRRCLERRVEGIGETIGFGQQGNSPHFARRRGGKARAP